MPHPRLDTTHPAHPDFDPADSFHTLRSFLNKPSTRSMTMQTQLSSIQLNIAIHKIGLVLGDFVAFHLIDQDQCKTIMKIVETTKSKENQNGAKSTTRDAKA